MHSLAFIPSKHHRLQFYLFLLLYVKLGSLISLSIVYVFTFLELRCFCWCAVVLPFCHTMAAYSQDGLQGIIYFNKLY